MRNVLFALLFGFFSAVTASQAAETSTEERLLVLAAEEISASAMDDDEKIARLTEIRAKVNAIRSRKTLTETPSAADSEKKSAESARPVSTLVQGQLREAALPSPEATEEERGPPPALRIGYWMGRLAGWTVVLGMSAAFLFLGYVRFLELCEGSGRSDLATLAFRLRMKTPWIRKCERQKAPPTRGIARDGMVPERLR